MSDVTLTVCVSQRNSEKTLPTCLESIERAVDGYEDRVEVLVLDDASTDGSLALAENFAQRHDNWFARPLPTHGGLGAGRNFGFAEGRGEFIWHIDGDDTLVPESIGRIVSILDEHAADPELDVVMFSANRTDDSGMRFATVSIVGAHACSVIPTNQAIVAWHYPQILFMPTTSWLRVYRRSVIDGVPGGHRKKIFYEDVDFNTRLYPSLRKVFVTDECLYNYWEHPKSIIRNDQVTVNLQVLDVFDGILAHYRERGLLRRYYAELEFLAVEQILNSRGRTVLIQSGRSQTFRTLRHYVEQHFPEWKDNCYLADLPLRRRLPALSVRYGLPRVAKVAFQGPSKLRKIKAYILRAANSSAR